MLWSVQALEAGLRDKYDESISYNDVMSAAMYPKVFDEYRWGHKVHQSALVMCYAKRLGNDSSTSVHCVVSQGLASSVQPLHGGAADARVPGTSLALPDAACTSDVYPAFCS